MKLEDHVPSLELCKKWKEIGGRQDTIHSWEFWEAKAWGTEKDAWTVQTTASILQADDCMVAAPLASELMEWMKEKLRSVKHTISYGWLVQLQDAPSNNDESLPNALMQIAIWEKEGE
jgi:hypothetical protein